MSDEETIDLGACCACGAEGPTVRNICMLPKKTLIPGTGWGCVVCKLPCDGASVVVCDACLEAIDDYPGKKLRCPIEQLTEPFEHDRSLHAAEEAPALPLLDLVTLVENAICGGPDYLEGVPEEWEDLDERTPLLEVYPDQAGLKSYLVTNGSLQFLAPVVLNGQEFNRLGAHGDLSWCCLPSCDRVIVGVPLLLFLREGEAGTIALHPACAERLIQGGVLTLELRPAEDEADDDGLEDLDGVLGPGPEDVA